MKVKNARLYALSVLVGLFAGIFGSAFRWLLEQSLTVRELMFRHNQTLLYYIIVIICMWVIAMIINWMITKIPLIGGSGIPQSRGVIFGRFKFTSPWKQFVSKFFGSLSAIGMGLSLGREGPSVEIGAIGASVIGKYFKTTPTEDRYLTVAGAGAGLAAAFTAPIASVVFLLEDLMKWVSLRISLPALISCFAAGYCAQFIFKENVYLTVPITYPDLGFWPLFLILAGFAFIGTVGGKLFNCCLFFCKRNYSNLHIPVILKLLVVIMITFFAGMLILDLISGGETELINQMLKDNGNIGWLFAMVLIKIILTAISYSTGLCGSLLLPLIVMGGLCGKAYALIFVQLGILSPTTVGFFTMIGMSAFFISVVRAPISGMMLILEMTGKYEIFYPMIITGTLTFLLGQYLHVKPVYDTLYQMMLQDEHRAYGKTVEVHFEVNAHSILLGRSVADIKLPPNSEIIGIKRVDTQTTAIDQPLKIGDVIQVNILSDQYEEIFHVIRALTNE